MLLLFTMFAALALQPISTGWQARTLEFDGLTRTYGVYVPERYMGDAPLVIALHPAGATGEGMALLTGFNRLADVDGWLVAYPDGPGGYWDYGAGTPEWEQVPGLRDDPGFIAAMIEAIAAEWSIDRDQIYAVGYSNGARMAYRLACELPLAGAAAVAATVSDEVTNACQPGHVPMLIMHGTADAVLPFEGKPDLYIDDLRIARALSIPETAVFYAGRNECASEPLIDETWVQGNQVTLNRVRYTGCADRSMVDVYVVEDGGHAWQHPVDVGTSRMIWVTIETWTLRTVEETPVPEATAEE